MKLIRIDSRYSALCFYRAWRRHLGLRGAYWLTVYRYGWTNWRGYAESQMSVTLRPRFGAGWEVFKRAA